MHEWNDLYIAVAGASAALTGLIFVGVSISLTKILANPKLAVRASISLILLMSILVFSIFILVPHETPTVFGWETTILGLIILAIVIRADLKVLSQTPNQYKRYYFFNLLFDLLAILPYIVGGVIILCIDNRGLYFILPAIVLSFIKSVSDAWVLLIEINR